MSTTATMSTRERLQAILRGCQPDRMPAVEWAMWWDETLARWHGEGLDPTLDRYELYHLFGLDDWRQSWLSLTSRECPKPPRHGSGIISNNDDYHNMRKYLLHTPHKNVQEIASWASLHQQGQCAIWFTMDGFFWFARELLGIENHLYAFTDQAELLHRINDDLANFIIDQLDELCAETTPDFMTFAEDLSGNTGPMISEITFNEFLLPYYKRVIPALKERGITPIIDSDGDITRCLPWFENAGLSGVLPLERAAGVNVTELQTAHPEMIFIGGYDKRVMNHGREAIREEFTRLQSAKNHGHFIVSCDHQTPPGVSLESYRTYLEELKIFTGAR